MRELSTWGTRRQITGFVGQGVPYTEHIAQPTKSRPPTELTPTVSRELSCEVSVTAPTLFFGRVDSRIVRSSGKGKQQSHGQNHVTGLSMESSTEARMEMMTIMS
jgi:hypothetical protein